MHTGVTFNKPHYILTKSREFVPISCVCSDPFVAVYICTLLSYILPLLQLFLVK